MDCPVLVEAFRIAAKLNGRDALLFAPGLRAVNPRDEGWSATGDGSGYGSGFLNGDGGGDGPWDGDGDGDMGGFGDSPTGDGYGRADSTSLQTY